MTKKCSQLSPDISFSYVRFRKPILLFEGNYLLFNEDGWADLSIEWDASIWLDVPQDVLEARLVQRWLDQGMPKDQALARARSNDLVNAKRIIANALPSTWVIRNENS